MAKKKQPLKFATCGSCMGRIDLLELQNAKDKGQEYRHWCGRILLKAR